MTRLALAACALLLAGCHSSTSIEGDTSTDTTVDPHADTSVDTLTDTSVDSPPDVHTDSTTTCPEPGPIEMNFTVDGDPWPDEGDDVHLPCTVGYVGEDPEGDHMMIVLHCMAEDGTPETHDLAIYGSAMPIIMIDPGEDVIFDYVAYHFWWNNRWFSVSDLDGNMIVAGVDADVLIPTTGSDEWYYPLRVRRMEHVCAPEEADCGMYERQALEVGYEDDAVVVHDHGFAAVGEYAAAYVYVGTLGSYMEMECDDIPDDWVNAFFTMQVRMP